MMKRITILILSLALIFALATPALADNSLHMRLSVDKTTVFRGDTIELALSVSGGGSCDTYGYSLSVDPAVYTITDVQILDTNRTYLKSFDHNGLVVAYSAPYVPEGTVCKVTLQVRQDAPIGPAPIKGTPAAKLGAEALSVSGTGVSILVQCAHEYTGWHLTDEATHTGTCTVCGEVKVTEHNWDTGAVTKPADCENTGTAVYTCLDCQVVKVEQLPASHVYDHGCDPDCNICGEERTITHQYGEDWSWDESGHFYSCVVCGAMPSKHVHTPDREKATSKAAVACTECGYILEPMTGHTHNYTQTYSMDANSHWLDCDGCMEKDQKQAHVYENACDESCNTCGYTRTITHDTGSYWTSDEAYHYRVCALCGKKVDVLQHAPGEKETELTARTCLVCGRELSAALGHSMSQEWFFDEEVHYHQCGCGEKSDVAKHTWSDHGEDGLVKCTVCDAKKEAIPMGVWIAMGAALIAAMGCMVTVLARRKKVTQ